MKVQLFTIRLTTEELLIDQNHLNNFLEKIIFKKSSTQFIETENNCYWSVLVYYEEFEESKMILPTQEVTKLSEFEQTIFQNLKNWRTEKSEQLGLKNYQICHNSELINIAIQKPKNLNQLRKIKGFGEVKSEKYGNEIITLLSAV